MDGAAERGNRLADAPEVSLSYGLDADIVEARWGPMSAHLNGAFVSA